MTSPELSAKIELWRQKAIEGTLSVDEMKEAIAALREGRISAAHTSANARKKAIREIPTAADLLDELDGL